MSQLVNSIKGLGATRLAALGASGALVLGLLIFMIARGGGGSAGMVPLYTNLSLQDGNRIISFLESSGTKYDIRGNGTQIMVPEEQVFQLRMRLAGEGLPSSGSVVGYEIFDKTEALGTSNFVYNVNLVRALEGELSRTIGGFNKIESARVHLVTPKRELFTREQMEPSASVAVKVAPGASLTSQEISSIRHLIATAVPGLKLEKITIVDNKGKLLARGGDEDVSAELAASNAAEFRQAYEARMARTVTELIEQSVGVNKVKAQVSADIDFDRIVVNSEEYDPDGQVVRSVQTSEENEQSSEKDVNDNVSVANNLPDQAASKSGVLSNNVASKTDETTNYEISKKVTSHVKETGNVKRLSIAVLVDGTYTPGEQEGQLVYTPRPQEELDKLEALVKTAVGYDEARGDTVRVINMQFTDSIPEDTGNSPLEWIKNDFSNVIQTLVFGAVAILFILLVIKPLVTRALDATTAHADDDDTEPSLALEGPTPMGQLPDFSGAVSGFDDEAGETMIDIERIQGKVKSSTIRKIHELIEGNPEQTLRTLRAWMHEARE